MLCRYLAAAAREPLRGRDVRCCGLVAHSILARCECRSLKDVGGCTDIGCKLIVKRFGSVDLPKDPEGSVEKETIFSNVNKLTRIQEN